MSRDELRNGTDAQNARRFRPLTTTICLALGAALLLAPMSTADAGGKRRGKSKESDTPTVSAPDTSTPDTSTPDTSTLDTSTSWTSTSWTSTSWTSASSWWDWWTPKVTDPSEDDKAAAVETVVEVAEVSVEVAEVVVEVAIEVAAAGVEVVDAFIAELNPTNIPVIAKDLLSLSVTPVEDLMGLQAAHERVRGQGITVAVLDGGFRRAGDAFMAQIDNESYDAVDGDSDPFEQGNGKDDDGDGIVDNGMGHGTFVAGMVLRVAPAATILPIRVADDEGRSTEAWITAGIKYAMSRKVDVINLSLDMHRLGEETKRYLWEAALGGFITVVSAGNDAQADLAGLADSGLTLAVGSTDAFDTVASFSNYNGEKENKTYWDMDSPLVFAPGVDLLGPSGFPNADTMCLWSGNSFATGLVSGALALSKELHGTMAWSVMVVGAVQRSIVPVVDGSGRVIEGTGRVDLRLLLDQFSVAEPKVEASAAEAEVKPEEDAYVNYWDWSTR